MSCARCGHENPGNARFCCKCGAPTVPRRSGKAVAGFWICLLFFAIAALDVVWVASNPPSGCMRLGPFAPLFLPFLLLGVLLAGLALREIGKSQGTLLGRRHAWSGLALTALAVVLLIIHGPVETASGRRHGWGASSAIGGLRSINTAEVTYAYTYPEIGFTCDLKALGPPIEGPPSAGAAGLLDAVLAGGTRSDYVFSLSGCTGTPSQTYSVTAVPLPGRTPLWVVCTDQSGVIRYTVGGSGEGCLREGKALQ